MNSVDFLDKLLDGVVVEWKEVGEVAQILNGFAFESTKYSSSGIRVIRISDVQKGKMSDKDMKFYPANTADEINKYLLREDDLVMSLTGNVGRVAMLSKTDLPAALNQRVACIRVNEEKTFTRYLFHFFDQLSFETEAMANATGGGQKNMSTKWLSSYKIPIPCPDNPKKSLEIQAEIVRILDSFTELTAELTTELTARKKQYNYYRDQLLSFEDGNVEWKALSEIGEFIRGKRFTKADYVEDGISVIHYGEIYTRYGVFTTHAYSQVGVDMAESLRYAEPGDVVITDVGETVEDVGKAVAWLGGEKVAIHDHCYAFRHMMNPKFVSYCMQTASFIAEKAKYVARTKVNTLLINGFSKIAIPVPYPDEREKSLAEQARIVAILDKFDALTASLTAGLPREIELRQKQYEYYRDLLLSFPKPEAPTVAQA